MINLTTPGCIYFFQCKFIAENIHFCTNVYLFIKRLHLYDLHIMILSCNLLGINYSQFTCYYYLKNLV